MKGDTIGVVSPSYAPKLGWLSRGVRALERAGFIVMLDPEIDRLPRFTRAEDERRAESLMRMWLDPEVKAIIASTGGYGAVRLLPHLDPAVFRDNPKVARRLLGHHRAASLAHAPRAPAQLSRPDGRRSHSEHARSDDVVARHRAHHAVSAQADRPRALARRRARPRNGTSRRRKSLARAADDRHVVSGRHGRRDPLHRRDARPDVGRRRTARPPARRRACSSKVSGIIFGQLSLDRSEEDEFEDFLLDLISDLDVPVLMDFPAGHENPNSTIPFGTEVELVVEDQRGWIVYREDALTAPVQTAS